MAWDLLEENFNDLTDWADGDTSDGVSQISPAGYLDQAVGAAGQAKIDQDIGTIGTGDYTVEFRVKPILLPTTQNVILVEAQTKSVYLQMLSDGFEVYDGGQFNKTNYAWDSGTYYVVRYIVHNSQTDMDVYINGSLEATDVDCSRTTALDGLVQISLHDANCHWSIDYLYMGAGQQVPSATSIKKVSGVAYASIKKIGGVAIGSVKKIAGVE